MAFIPEWLKPDYEHSRPEPDTDPPSERPRSVSEKYFGYSGPPTNPNAVPQFEGATMGYVPTMNSYRNRIRKTKEDITMENDEWIRSQKHHQLRERGFSNTEIEVLLSGEHIEATYNNIQKNALYESVVPPKAKKPIISTRFIKNAIENKSLAASMDRMEEVIRDQIQKVVKEEFKGSEVIEEGPLMIDRVVKVVVSYSSCYHVDSTGAQHTNHPDTLNTFMSNVLNVGGKIISIQYIDAHAMVHYKAPEGIVIYV